MCYSETELKWQKNYFRLAKLYNVNSNMCCIIIARLTLRSAVAFIFIEYKVLRSHIIIYMQILSLKQGVNVT